MRFVALAAALTLVGPASRVSLAQVRSVADEQRSLAEASRGSPETALAEWEAAVAERVTDAETWSAIGLRLYATGRYKESSAACERSFVLRDKHSPDDARCIADAYEKLGNVKQALRWRMQGGGRVVPSRRHLVNTV